MTAPVRTIAAKFTAQGSEVVREAIDRVTASAVRASDRAAAAAAKSAARMAEAQQVAAQQMFRSRGMAERAAYAEDALRERMAQRAIAAAQRVALVQMGSTSRTAGMMQTSMSRTAKSIAISLDMIAVSGQATGAVLRRVVSDAANLALMFSTRGPILAAIGIAGIAVFNFFANAREERKKLAEESADALKRMVNAGDWEGIHAKMRQLWIGTPEGEYADGIMAIEKRIRELEKGIGLFDFERLAAIDREKEALASLRKEYDLYLAATKNPANGLRAPLSPPRTTTTAPEGRLFPKSDIRTFQAGAPFTPRLGDYSQRLNPRVDATLASYTAIRPLGDPKKFADQLNKDIVDGFHGFKLPPLPEPVQWRQQFAAQVSNALIDGFASGIEQAIASGSIGDGFAALTGSLLSGLGSAMVEFGKASLIASNLMKAIFAALGGLNPGGAATASIAMIAIGSALRGVAARAFGAMGGGGHGGSGRSFGSLGTAASASSGAATRLVFGSNSLSTAAGMEPRFAGQIIVIGEDDPRAQRAITNILRNAEGRGLTTRRG